MAGIQSTCGLYYDKYNVWDRSHAAKKLKDLWEYYAQTCKDCGPYHPATKAAHDEVYQKMFTYLMYIESTYTIFEECNNTYTRYRSSLSFKGHIIDNTKVGPVETPIKQEEWPCKNQELYFRINTYTDDEEDIYERIEASLVSPLITLKRSYTYNF